MTCRVEDCSSPGTTGTPELCVKHKFSGGLRVNGIALFKHDRELGLTQMEKGKEMYDHAKKDGRDIMQVRGFRTAHEKKIDGEWVKV